MCSAYEQEVDKQEGLVNDVYAAIFDSLDSFRGDADLKTWVYRVAVNVGIKYVKRKEYEKKNLDLDQDVDEIARHNTIEKKIDFKIMVEYASTFRPIDRELIYLYLIGETQNDIANILGLTVANVSTKILRLKKRITIYMNKGNPDE